jgi:hypothetical protein
MGWLHSMRPMIGGRLTVVATTVAVAALGPLLAKPANGWGPYNHLDRGFCDTSTVRGKTAELQRLPALPKAPGAERLPFPPDTLRLRSYDQFQVGEGKVGFMLRQADGHRTDALGLRVEASFAQVDRRGAVLRQLGDTEVKVGSIKGYDTLSFAITVGAAGLYRATILFERPTGKRLRYGAYFRVFPLIVGRPRVVLNATTLQPGDLLLARVENFSRTDISYGVPYVIERWNGTEWERAPETPNAWVRPLYRSRPGTTGPCLPFRAPQEMASGSYRFVKPVTVGGGTRRLVADFAIATP